MHSSSPEEGYIDELKAERDEAREALKAAHHALACVHGLWATDHWPGQDVSLFRIDTLKTIEKIEAVLKGAGDEG